MRTSRPSPQEQGGVDPPKGGQHPAGCPVGHELKCNKSSGRVQVQGVALVPGQPRVAAPEPSSAGEQPAP